MAVALINPLAVFFDQANGAEFLMDGMLTLFDRNKALADVAGFYSETGNAFEQYTPCAMSLWSFVLLGVSVLICGLIVNGKNIDQSI